ncbi:hypothetical protein OAL63_00535 [Candidatus Pelagibacter sp.]|jgi:hypothetical protein|nr:hypothetical protein [Candidatus Pelagibacter sp.]|tara:strand:- start:22 stop:909 length:888 start_codon:yes stop_codon:yes gene_type:complete
MKKLLGIVVLGLLLSGNVFAVEKFKFKYHIADNLAKEWVTEFNKIMNIVQEVMPINENTNSWVKRELNRMEPFNIYAWNRSKNPFKKFTKGKGSGVRSDSRGRWMQLDIKSSEKNHSYSVVVHEYFHVYQIALSEDKFFDRDTAKWLGEGGAKVLQEIYSNQYYGKDMLKKDIQKSERWSIKKVTKEPHLYEKHYSSPTKKGFDGNYTGSAFMVLALVNELKKNNISEEEAFELVFREFWVQRAKQPSGQLWQPAFKNTFGMSHDEFYERLSKYKRKDLKKILPSKTLKIQDIFS